MINAIIKDGGIKNAWMAHRSYFSEENELGLERWVAIPQKELKMKQNGPSVVTYLMHIWWSSCSKFWFIILWLARFWFPWSKWTSLMSIIWKRDGPSNIFLFLTWPIHHQVLYMLPFFLNLFIYLSMNWLRPGPATLIYRLAHCNSLIASFPVFATALLQYILQTMV